MIEFLANRCIAFEPVGSSVTCDPPVLDTDRDYLLYLEQGPNAGAIYNFLHDNEYVNESVIETPVTTIPENGYVPADGRRIEAPGLTTAFGGAHTHTILTQRYPEARVSATDGGFESWRKDNINLIITYSKEFFDKFMAASDVCRKLNVLNKEDRVMVFEAVRNLKRHP